MLEENPECVSITLTSTEVAALLQMDIPAVVKQQLDGISRASWILTLPADEAEELRTQIAQYVVANTFDAEGFPNETGQVLDGIVDKIFEVNP